MPVEVTIRHMKVPDAIQSYARAKAEALQEEFPRIEHVHVIVDQEKRVHVVEIVVQARRHIRVEAKDANENLRTAIDVATEKVEKQLRKVTEKVLDSRVRAVRKKAVKASPAAGEIEGGVL